MADADKDDEPQKKEGDPVAGDPAAKKSLVKRLLPYIAGGAVSIGLGVGAGIVKNKDHEKAHGESAGEKKLPVTLDQYPCEVKLELPKQIFNCADTGQNVAGTLNIQLEIHTTEKWGLPKDKPPIWALIDPKVAEAKYYGRIRDGLVMLLSTKVSNDLKTARGKEVLKLEILEKMNAILFSGDKDDEPKGIVTGVLFTDFLVQ